MTKKDIINKLNSLPKGALTKKSIKKANGKVYTYTFLQWTEDGKQKSKRIDDKDIDSIKYKLDERKDFERMLVLHEYDSEGLVLDFNCTVKVGLELRLLSMGVKDYKRRFGYLKIKDYINYNTFGKVFIIYGLRRTGKTTLIHQIINDMDMDQFSKTAFIQITRKDTFSNFNKDLMLLQNNGYKYVFVDEVTFMEDFIEGASLLSDIYASSGMKIVLSGTDSLGFWLTKSNELFDRAIFMHTTFISYNEFSNVLGINGIDKYIEYGGTMSASGARYNVFSSMESTNEYIDSSIAQNIQHSLKYYQYEGHFRHLYDLYSKGELTSAINRVVEEINHRFTIEVLERKFKSNDLRNSSNNLRKDRNNPSTILDDIDVDEVTKRLKELLSIKDKEEQVVNIDNIHVKQIEEYLLALDLIDNIDIVSGGFDKPDYKRIVFTQPGLRFSQAKSLVLSLKNDSYFRSLLIEVQEKVIERILNEIKERMVEDIILLETKLTKVNKDVFKLQFSNGEFDMVVRDKESYELELYEIKYSSNAIISQARHLLNKEKCDYTELHFGKITKKTVLYRGDNKIQDNVNYQNIEEYLNNLYK